jgi:hypothetical protein
VWSIIRDSELSFSVDKVILIWSKGIRAGKGIQHEPGQDMELASIIVLLTTSEEPSL